MNRSQDGGSTWETPVEFTNDVKDTVNWNAMSTTSRAIVTSSGRVIIPIAHVDSSNEWYSELCYTDDFASGRPTLSTVTWNRGGDVGGVENNEASVFEAGSNLLVPFRQANNETTDKRYTSHSSVTTNDSSANYFPLMDHGVFTAFHKYRGVVLVAEIADEGPGFARRNPTLRWSEDNGATWNVPGEPATAYPWGTLVAHTGGQYTSVVADDNYVYIVFEKGYLSNVASIGDLTGAINLVRMPVSTLGITYATSGSALPIIMQLLGA